MGLKRIEINVPEEMVPFMLVADGEGQLRRNAMLLNPYIQDGVISHGKAAEILGIHKLDLLCLYGEMGLPYMDESEEVLQDVQAIRKVRGNGV